MGPGCAPPSREGFERGQRRLRCDCEHGMTRITKLVHRKSSFQNQKYHYFVFNVCASKTSNGNGWPLDGGATCRVRTLREADGVILVSSAYSKFSSSEPTGERPGDWIQPETLKHSVRRVPPSPESRSHKPHDPYSIASRASL